MRRKSNRTTSKTTPEKPVESTRRSRRQSKRQKKSSSRSSSEEPKENVVVEQEQHQESKEPEQTPQAEEQTVTEEQPMWKVTPSSTPTGEIQKLKFCLTRPLLSPEKSEKPVRGRRSKSGGQTDEDAQEKVCRKLRHRGSSGDNVDEQDDDSDHPEDKKGKGKSKTKHKSKSEKAPQIQELKDSSQSEISENVQVTAQSPQAPIDNAVDNENMSTNESETVVSDETDQLVSRPVETSTENSDKPIGDTVGDILDDSVTNRDSDTPPPILEQQEVNSNISHEQFESAPELVRVDSEPVTEVVEEEVQLKVEDTKEQEEKVVKCNDSETSVKVDEEVIQTSPMEVQEEVKEEESVECVETPVNQDISESCSSFGGENEKSNDVPEENVQETNLNNESVNTVAMEAENNCSDNDSVSIDAIMDTSSTKDATSLDITQSFSPDLRQIEEVNEDLQSLKNVAAQILEDVAKAPVVRDWGDSCIALELMKNSIKKIDINAIKEICPNLQFLDENEVKMNIRERKTSYSQEARERRIDRKVSIEFKTDDPELKRLSTENSVNSEMDETTEPEVDNANIIAMNRKISIVDDTASKLKPPPSPAKNPISELLYITNLVRPFTLKQLKELLERTGKIRENGFWTDRIKSKCYAYYETIEEAEATRNALHGVNWPIGNGKKLIIEYATEEDLEKARNPTPPSSTLTVPQPLMANVATVEKQVVADEPPKNKIEENTNKERQHTRNDGHVREWDIGKENMQKAHYRSREHEDRERERVRERERSERHKRRRTPSPTENYLNKKEKKKEEDIPQKLMDDLFRKTKTTPSIYWLPLTPEEIATKQQQRLMRMAEHKRRMEESSRSRGDYGRGAPYRRRYD